MIKWPALTADLWLDGSVLCSVQQLWHGPLELRQIIMIAGSLQSSDQNQVKLCRKTNTQQQQKKKKKQKHLLEENSYMSCDYVKWIMQVGLIVFFSLNYDDKYQHKAKLNSDIISRSSWV